MKAIDLVIISKAECIDYDTYCQLPLDRIELFKNLTQLRMIYFEGGFRSHLDILNKAIYNKYFNQAEYEERRKMLSIWNLFSLNSALAIAPLVNDRYNCKIINNFDAEFDLLCEYCDSEDKPLICISTTFMLNWSQVARVVCKIRRAIKNVKIALGGAFVNDQYINHGVNTFESPMAKYGIDYIVHSFNAEKDLLDLIRCCKLDQLEMVNNLVYFDKSGDFRNTRENWNIANLEDCPIPWDKVNIPDYTSTLQLRTSSGCPFACSFCTYPVASRGFHQRDPEQVLRPQLEKIKRLTNIKSLIFIDDTPNIPKDRFIKILNILTEYDFRWYSFLRVQFVDEDIVRLMRSSGCDGVYLGLESTDDKILKAMNKKATSANYSIGVNLLNKYGIRMLAAFIIGFPGETSDSVKENIAFIRNNNIPYYSLKEFYYLHTAPIHQQREQFNLNGIGNEWQHNTMTSIQASEMKSELFKEVNDSIYVDADISLWYLAYLRDRGLSWNSIDKVQRTLNEMMKRDEEGFYENKEDLFAVIRETVRGEIIAF